MILSLIIIYLFYGDGQINEERYTTTTLKTVLSYLRRRHKNQSSVVRDDYEAQCDRSVAW